MLKHRYWALPAAACLLIGWVSPARAAYRMVVAVDPGGHLDHAQLLQPAGRSGLAPGAPVDLDLGENDYLQVRVTLPAAGRQPVVIRYATAAASASANSGSLTLPTGALIRDGRPHTYRLDLGLEVRWRDQLTSVQPQLPPGSSLETIEVGDLPGDRLAVNDDLNIFVGDDQHRAETRADIKRVESKHFVFWYSPMSWVQDKGFDPAVMSRRALRMSEECYQVYCKLAGYREPFRKPDPAGLKGPRCKVNITSWYGGTWMGGQNGWTYYNIPGWGLRDEGWGNPVPHEFGHAVQGAQSGFLNGAYWESHANYLRELRNRHYRELLPGYSTSLERGILAQSCVMQDHQRFIYADFRLHLALDAVESELGLGAGLAARLWTTPPRERMAYAKLAACLPRGRSVKDVAAAGLRRFALLDLPDGAAYRRALRGTPALAEAYDRAVGSYLDPCPGRPGWWRVPWSRSPMRYGYMFHRLQPARSGGLVAVRLRGIDVVGDREDWRWCFVAEEASGRARYSPISGPGTLEFQTRPSDRGLYLVVVATPGVLDLSPAGFQDRYPLDRDPGFLRYPYEVHMDGGVPWASLSAPAPAGARRHPNGGGWVAATAQVDPSAYVARGARVLDRARVRGRARITGSAVVAEDAEVGDDAMVTDHAWVGGRAVLKGYCHVGDQATVRGNSVLADQSRVQGYAVLQGVNLGGLAIVRGNATPWDCRVNGHAILDYDYSMPFNLSDGVHFNHVPWGGWFEPYWAAIQRKPRALLASYRMEQPQGGVLWDEFGGLNALLVGAPTVAYSPVRRTRVLCLDGKAQWVDLDRALCDAQALTASLWFRANATRDRRCLLHLGRTDGAALALTVGRDLACTVKAGGGATTHAVPVRRGEWTHVAVSLGGGSLVLTVNGRPAGRWDCSTVPNDLLAPAGAATSFCTAGRAPGGQFYEGEIADLRFYNDAIPPAEIASEMERSGDLLLRTCVRPVTPSPGDLVETGIRNAPTRTLAVWIRPAVAKADAELPIFDSRDEREPTRTGLGLSIRDGKVDAYLDGVGEWKTGVAIRPDQWQHIALATDGRSARLYLNGVEAAARTSAANAARRSTRNFRVGFARLPGEPAPVVLYQGALQDARIYNRMLGQPEIAGLAAQVQSR